jgi:hypothetical protein
MQEKRSLGRIQKSKLTSKKEKSPLDKKKNTTNEQDKNPPHIAIFFVCCLKVLVIILNGKWKETKVNFGGEKQEALLKRRIQPHIKLTFLFLRNSCLVIAFNIFNLFLLGQCFAV